jgi:pSer/pThr/pTyr-binding forkhead associated (FHA) protein
VVVDLGSTNGTMVNGVRIVGEQRLDEGDIVSFGSTHVRFEAS